MNADINRTVLFFYFKIIIIIIIFIVFPARFTEHVIEMQQVIPTSVLNTNTETDTHIRNIKQTLIQILTVCYIPESNNLTVFPLTGHFIRYTCSTAC